MPYIGQKPHDKVVTASEISDGIITADKLASDSVTTAKIADNGVTTAKINADAVTDAKVADDVIGTEHLTAGEVDTTALGADAVTAAKIADNAISEEHLDSTVITGLTALGEAPAYTDEFLVSDGGTLKKIDYSYIKGEANSPYFRAYIGGSSNLSDNVTTKVVYDTTSWNVGGTYATGTYRWTPGVQGRYFIHAQVTINWSDSAADRIDLLIRKNGSNVIYRRLKSGGNFGGNESSTIVSGTVDLDSDDYVEVFCEQHSGSTRGYSGNSAYNFWEGFLIATY